MGACRTHALLTYQHFPLAVGLGHFVSTAHLIQAHTPEDENDEAGAAAVLPGGLILVPMSIAGTEGERADTGDSVPGDSHKAPSCSHRSSVLPCRGLSCDCHSHKYPGSSQQLCLDGSHPDVWACLGVHHRASSLQSSHAKKLMEARLSGTVSPGTERTCSLTSRSLTGWEMLNIVGQSQGRRALLRRYQEVKSS